MVAQSSMAFRLLCRRYGAELCYTPMINAKMYVQHAKYRRDVGLDLKAAEAGVDRPLCAQFCGDNAETLLLAARGVEKFVDGIDLNLGCPQGIAKRGHYGAFLLEEIDLVCEIVKTLRENLSVPVTCKIRLLDAYDPSSTIAFVERVVDAGASAVCIHGRTRQMKGQLVGEADWKAIGQVIEATKKKRGAVPIMANGGVEFYEDFANCLRETKADAVMISEAALADPRVLGTSQNSKLDVAVEFVELASSKIAIESTKLPEVRGHLVKILFEYIQADGHHAYRDALIGSLTWPHLKEAVHLIRRDLRNFQPTKHPFTWYRRHRKDQYEASSSDQNYALYDGRGALERQTITTSHQKNINPFALLDDNDNDDDQGIGGLFQDDDE